MDQFIEKMLETLGGDYGRALVKLYGTTENGYKVTLDELKKLSALLEDNLNQTTLRGICKMVSQKYAITEKLKEALELNKVSNKLVKKAIKKIEQFDQSMIEDAEKSLLEGDGRKDAAEDKIFSDLKEIYNAVEQIISSETPAPTLLDMANNIADSIQVGLGELISNNQAIVDAFQAMTSLYINNVESQISIIRTQDPRFMQEEIEANADELNQEWYPLQESTQMKTNVEKDQEELTTKVHEIFTKIKSIRN